MTILTSGLGLNQIQKQFHGTNVYQLLLMMGSKFDLTARLMQLIFQFLTSQVSSKLSWELEIIIIVTFPSCSHLLKFSSREGGGGERGKGQGCLTLFLRLVRMNSITPGLLATTPWIMSSGRLKLRRENTFPASRI